MGGGGQISLEYLIVVAFVVFAVIIILGISIFYTSSAQDHIKISQLSAFAKKITASAESVFYSGEPSKVTVTAYLPEGVENFQAVSDNLVFTIGTSSGTSTIAFKSDVPLGSVTFSLNEGVKRLVISAGADEVDVLQS